MFERVATVVASVMKVPVETVVPETTSETLEGWDSLRHMRLVLSLEEEFGVEFTDEEIVELTSIASILKVLQ